MILEQKKVTCEIDEEGFDIINKCDNIMNDIDAIIEKIWSFSEESFLSWEDDNDPQGNLREAIQELDDAKNFVNAFRKYVYKHRVTVKEEDIIN